jgi:hypothetical protein
MGKTQQNNRRYYQNNNTQQEPGKINCEFLLYFWNSAFLTHIILDLLTKALITLSFTAQNV